MNFGIGDAIEHENDFNVREFIQSRQGFLRKSRGIQLDTRRHTAPDVIHRLMNRAVDNADRGQGNLGHDSILIDVVAHALVRAAFTLL